MEMPILVADPSTESRVCMSGPPNTAEVSSACPLGDASGPSGQWVSTPSGPLGILQKGLDLLQEVGEVVMEELERGCPGNINLRRAWVLGPWGSWSCRSGRTGESGGGGVESGLSRSHPCTNEPDRRS